MRCRGQTVSPEWEEEGTAGKGWQPGGWAGLAG